MKKLLLVLLLVILVFTLTNGLLMSLVGAEITQAISG